MDLKTNPKNEATKMGRLQQLIQAQIVFLNDVLYFSFKKHVFTGKVTKGGLIWKCTWQKPGEDAVPVFSSASSIENQRFVRTFESLTDWTETCIQECLDEYHTRYSSWKRVRHQRTEKPMEILFKHLQKKKMHKNSPAHTNTKHILLYEQIAAHAHHIEEQNQRLEEWVKWYTDKFPSQPLPVAPVETPPDSAADPHDEAQAQPFVLTSDTGQYMVLHRMHEVAPPECVSWLQRNGPDNWQNMLKKLPTTVEFEPLTGPADNASSKQFVHDFFAHNSL